MQSSFCLPRQACVNILEQWHRSRCPKHLGIQLWDGVSSDLDLDLDLMEYLHVYDEPQWDQSKSVLLVSSGESCK